MDRIREVVEKKRRYAVFPMVCADHCASLLGLKFQEVAVDGEKLAAVLEYGLKKYNYDMLLVFSDPYIEAQALGCPVKLDPFPTLTGSKTDHTIDRTPEIIKALKILKEKVDVPIFVSVKGPFSLAAFLAGIKEFLKMTLKNKSETRKLIEEALDFQKRYLNKLLCLEANIFIGDPVASGSVISPEIFSEFAYGPLKELVKEIKNKRLLAALHICGDTKPIIEQLDTLGLDILSLEDITIKTKTLKMGGVATNTILYGLPADIHQEITEALQEPYLILSTACDVPVETAPEQIETMINYSHELCNN